MINYESVHAVNGKLSPKKISKIPLKEIISFITEEQGIKLLHIFNSEWGRGQHVYRWRLNN
jgi:hypothetical protein